MGSGGAWGTVSPAVLDVCLCSARRSGSVLPLVEVAAWNGQECLLVTHQTTAVSYSPLVVSDPAQFRNYKSPLCVSPSLFFKGTQPQYTPLENNILIFDRHHTPEPDQERIGRGMRPRATTQHRIFCKNASFIFHFSGYALLEYPTTQKGGGTDHWP